MWLYDWMLLFEFEYWLTANSWNIQYPCLTLDFWFLINEACILLSSLQGAEKQFNINFNWEGEEMTRINDWLGVFRWIWGLETFKREWWCWSSGWYTIYKVPEEDDLWPFESYTVHMACKWLCIMHCAVKFLFLDIRSIKAAWAAMRMTLRFDRAAP